MVVALFAVAVLFATFRAPRDAISDGIGSNGSALIANAVSPILPIAGSIHATVRCPADNVDDRDRISASPALIGSHQWTAA